MAMIPLKSGVWSGSPTYTIQELYTSVLISGGYASRFVTYTGGYVTPCTDSTQTIAGWMESETITAANNTSSGLYSRPCIMYDPSTIFICPVYNVAYAATYKGVAVDVIVDTVQKVYLEQSTHDLLLVVGGYIGSTAALSYVLVQMNPNEFYRG